MSKKFYELSSVFYGREKEQSQLANSSLENMKDLKPNTAKTILQFDKQSSIEDQKANLSKHSHAIFDAIGDVLDKAYHDTELISYITPLLDGIISDDRKNGSPIIKMIKQNRDTTYIKALQKLLQSNRFSIIVHEAAAKVLAWILTELDPREFGQEQKSFLKLVLTLRDTKQDTQKIRLGDYNFLQTLVYLLRQESLVALFIDNNGPQILANFMSNYSSDLQISYYTLLCCWLLSYSEDSKPVFADPVLGLIRLIADVISKLSREKLVRVAFQTFRNLCDLSHEAIELMVDAKLIKFIEILLKGNIKDEDVLEDLKYVGEILEANLKILTSFEKYLKELNSQKFEWSPVHTEKFWRENIKKFEEDDYKSIKKVLDLLENNSPKNQAIACYDIGEFCRFHPFGRHVLETKQAKSRIMKLTQSEDQTVREHALLALQKIMLHNWNISK